MNHAALLDKLSKLLPSWLCSWIAAYLSNRRQRVIHNHTPTAWKNVLAGVIQGSVIGPILFLLFISDINAYIPIQANLHKYADDILAYITGNFDDSLPQAIANGVQKWCAADKMQLNVGKCKLLHIGLSSSLPVVMLDNIVLEYVDSYKYLGVPLNARLDPSEQ